jgi:sodium pump decarboxylase gamma subunit
LDTTIAQGLTITVLGLFITFLALGVFILIMVLLQKAFPYKEEPEEGEEEDEAHEVSMAVEAGEDGEDLGAVAAIAAAIAYLRSNTTSKLGSNLEAGRGSWWMVNRMAARQAANLLKK